MLEKAKSMPKIEKSETDKFLEGIKDESIDLETKEVITEKIDDPEKVPESIKNRQHRRLEERLQKERETNIALNERLKAKEDLMQNVVKEVPIDSRLKRLFGEDEKGLEIAKHFTEILSETKGQAREEAIKELRAESERMKREEAEQIRTYESKIESGLESIEDEYNVDLTSQSSVKSRKEFLDFVTKIAPKDKDGSPTELPDLVGAYEVFKNLKPKESNRRTEIASRSMQTVGQPNLEKERISDEEKWLIDNGIIRPRRK